MNMEFTFINAAGVVLFVRDDAEQANWTQEEYSVNATFPYIEGKVIQRGQRIMFRDPATNVLEVYEIRNVNTIEPDHYQQIIAENIALSELSDEHINGSEITNKTPEQALTTALTGTLWSVGNVTATNVSSCNFSRGNVWQAIQAIQTNWNVYIVPRVVFNAAGTAITGRYLDITPAQGVFRGVRLSIEKNMLDASVIYDDSDVLTAMYGYGGNVGKSHTGGDDTREELTFADVVWTATAGHPAKPAGQTYLEDPAKTAIYGRNGRPRYGYYQNADIKDANVLLEKTWESLKQTSEPKISISGMVIDLYRLGYHDEPLRLHDTVIVEIKETGETFEKEIIRLDVDLIDPTATRPEIGDYIPNIIYINRDTDKKSGGGGGGGGGRGMTNLEDDKVKAWTEFYNNGDRIGMIVKTRNGDNYIDAPQISLAINESGEEGSYTTTAYIQANHVDISATDTVHTLAGDLEHDAQGRLVIKNAGGMYVERNEQGTTSYFGVWDRGNLTGGVMVQQINGQQGTKLTLQADVIDIDGVVTALITKDLECNNMNINGTAYLSDTDFDGNVSQSSGYAAFLDLRILDTLTAGGVAHTPSWKSTSLVKINGMTDSHRFLYAPSGLDPTGGATGRLISSYSDIQLHYLGY